MPAPEPGPHDENYPVYVTFETLKFWQLILVWFVLLAFTGCRTSKDYHAKPSGETPEPEIDIIVFHSSDSLTNVYLRISNEQLLYRRPDTSHTFYVQTKLFYELVRESDRRLVDSSTFYVFDPAPGEQVPVKSIYSRFVTRAQSGENYQLHLELLDINRRARFSKVVPLLKGNKSNAQNFLVYRRDTVVFNRYFAHQDTLQIKYSWPEVSSLEARYFAREFGPALPPFSTKEVPATGSPDSTFTLKKSGETFQVEMPLKGFYHISAAPGQQDGLSLFTFDAHFPAIGTADEMIECARYIMTRDEFDACKGAVDRKAAIDKFWLGIGGSNERARELLKRYYGRVQEANKHFSSFTEGWKTDRGMIFVIFGMPTNVYKSRKDEVWVYGNEANPSTLRFVFNKMRTPYSENDYVLERSQFYMDPWYGAVDYWRQGHVYSDRRR